MSDRTDLLKVSFRVCGRWKMDHGQNSAIHLTTMVLSHTCGFQEALQGDPASQDTRVYACCHSIEARVSHSRGKARHSQASSPPVEETKDSASGDS